MNQAELREVIERFQEENTPVELIEELKKILVEKMDELPTEDSDANEHRLNMIIRDLEEEIHRIESEKLGEWDPEKE